MKFVTDAHPNDFSWFLQNANGDNILDARIKYMQPYGFYQHYHCVTVELNKVTSLIDWFI